MKPHSILLTAICLPLLLVMGACKPDKPKDPITITYKLGEVKDYMYFKPGTWWVYEHDLTKERDSQYVTSSFIGPSTTKGTEEWSKHITLVQETMSMRIRSNFKDGWGAYNYFDIYTTGQNVNASPYPDLAFVFTRGKRPDNGMSGSSSDVFGYPYYTSPKKTVYMDTMYTNYQLNNFTYDTVRVFAVTYGDAVMQMPKVPVHFAAAKCYYAKNVGIIRVTQKTSRVLDDTPYIHSWNLIKKNIIQ
jgi:hypothetical protein